MRIDNGSLGTPDRPSDALWEVRMTPDKGRGLFALVDILRGRRLLVEDPLVTVMPPPVVPGVGFSIAALQPVVADAYARLTDSQQEAYLSCHEVRFGDEGKDETDNDGVYSSRLMRILRSNAYNTRDGRVALYPDVALINHDCRPNVLNTDVLDPTTGVYRRVIVAARAIAAGDELVTTYIPLLADTATRRTRLAQYGFTCMCTSCAAASVHDDAERVHMQHVLDELEEAAALGPGSQERELAFAHRAGKLAAYIAEHGFVDYAVRTSKLAAEFALRAGDTEASAHWAEVHHEDLEMAGDQNEDGI
ncbi:uncharacterized protein SPSK_07749 [Sporothrix schenckii 1099-18]|uniref:SET domain-containing protein n=2 Tax=Sporothrix schenckii TaxID=29908 RepID=U7PZR3_SPOS1|nr:uncharacterized protein SPSK_07749 [Sporothrix schenckii 1099-18]ERT01144.1 hypothetical protein HMPREF1624_02384 [Sporothrix schenckii ATCC 58251]KJR88278.1 hypothetical protein SPSK_07749 [Sporothrix schenckii 1099-18]